MSSDETSEKPGSHDTQQDKGKDTHSKRIRFRKTETSRLKPISDEGSGEGREEGAPVSLPTSAKPAIPAGSPGRTAVVDPMALRDTNTSKVKRVQAAKDSSPLATVSLPGAGAPLKKTETVQLKVVQQKKKELDQEMNPASTVRLKSPGGAGPSIAIPKSRPAAVPRDTMKISLPKLERKASDETSDPASATVAKPAAGAPPVSSAAAKPAPASEASPQQTARFEPTPVKTSTTVLEKLKPKKTDSETSTADTAPKADEGKTVSAPSPESAAGGKTFKLRGGAKSVKTLKVKSDDGDKTVAVEEAPSDEAKTIKVDDSAKGLKLKSRQQPLAEAPIVAKTTAAAERPVAAPGVLYTLGAAATLVAVGVTTYFLAMQAVAYIF